MNMIFSKFAKVVLIARINRQILTMLLKSLQSIAKARDKFKRHDYKGFQVAYDHDIYE